MDTEDRAYLVDGKYGIRDLVDLAELRRIFERFTAATGFTIGFLDHPGLNVLIESGWRDICTQFHRSCPVSFANCVQSNRHLLDHLDVPGKLVIEACGNGLVDCAFPIIIKGKHIASLATGQLLLGEPDLERFKRQAGHFGFDEHEYLRALAEIPVVSEERLRSVTLFLGEMASLISELGYAKLTARETAEQLTSEIAERKNAEERYTAIFRGAMEGILVADMATRRFLYANPAICRMLGCSEEELKKLQVEDIHPAASRSYVLAEFAAQYRGERMAGLDVPCLRKDGTVFYASITACGTHLDGRPCNVGFFTDITARRQAEVAQEKLEAQLQHAQKMDSVGRLAGGVAHDFNNMLQVILGHVEMAMEQVSPASPLQSDLAEIQKAAEHSADLTRRLLAFGRKQMIVPSVLNLNETVGGVLVMLRRLIGEEINLVWRPAAELWSVKVDSSQVEQILTNLCVNARDAISGGGTITVETGNRALDEEDCAAQATLTPGDYVLLSVSDSGCGMDAETKTHLFEPFYTTKDVGKGSGLGLAMVYGIVKQNSGFVSVDSEPGHGSTFSIFLARHQGPPDPERLEKETGPLARGCETILLVEDESTTLKMATALLTKQGYTVLATNSAAEALRLAGTHDGEIHLLVTDVIMPEMNGRILAQKLQAIRPQLKSLYMSGYAANVVAHHGVLDEGVHFIQKPFRSKALAAKVRSLLDAS
ncbi:MAG: PocR ligand-binding domain-containing protein [bacterium]